MGKIRDFSSQAEANLLGLIQQSEVKLLTLHNGTYVSLSYQDYVREVLAGNILTKSMVKQIFDDVRAVEGKYHAYFADKKGSVEFFNTLVRTLYNSVIDRDAPCDPAGLLGVSLDRYSLSEYAHVYPQGPDGEIDWEYVTALLNGDIETDWPELMLARAMVLSELYFDTTRVSDQGIVYTNYSKLEKLIQAGYGSTMSLDENGREVYECELSPMAILAMTAYRMRASSYTSDNSHYAFTGPRADSEGGTMGSPTSSDEVIRTRLVLAEMDKCDVLDWFLQNQRYTSFMPLATSKPSVWKASDGTLHCRTSIHKSISFPPFQGNLSEEELDLDLTVFGKNISADLRTLKLQYDPDSAIAWAGTDAVVSILLTPLKGAGDVLGIAYGGVRAYFDTQNNKMYIEELNASIDLFLAVWSGQLGEIYNQHMLTEAFAVGGRPITNAQGEITGISGHSNATDLELRVRAYGNPSLTSGADLLSLDPNNPVDREIIRGYVEFCGGSGPVAEADYKRRLNLLLQQYKIEHPGELMWVGSVENLSPAQIAELDRQDRDSRYQPTLGDGYTERRPLGG
ncbi:MAG: hypothetical protein FWG40_06500 [Peptococcaceae bacterium]|nr:hypothetical protein [Peptococcaceae bacterium]